VAQRRKKASPKPRSRSPQQTVESLRRALTRERALRKQGLAREKEALERQTATAEILKVIASSPSDVQPVFEAVAQRAAQLCNAANASVSIAEGTDLHRVAIFGHSTALTGRPTAARRTWINGRAFLERRTVHVEDVIAMFDEYPETREGQQKLGFRTIVAVPMIREGKAVGTIGVWRREVKPFSKTQIELLETFAAQAVIAIENVRLFNETKEALERQTATAEILKVIAASPSDVQPVFDAIAKAAVRLIGGLSAGVTRVIDDTVHLAAFTSVNPSGDEALKATFPRPVSEGLIGEAIRSRLPVLCADMETEPGIAANVREAARARGYRSVIVMPMIREGAAIGTLTVTRDTPGAFSDHQVRLLQTFADQAVIAIENVRLFNELQATNSTLREALEQQTATGEILKVIAGATTGVQPVFDSIVRNAVRLGNAAAGWLVSYDGTAMQLAAQYNVDPDHESVYRPTFPRPAARDTMTGRSIVDRVVINVPDILSSDFGEAVKERARRAGYRSALVVPMLQGRVPIGALNIQRREAGAFPD
jgi:GAF domain-containing protein